MTDRSTRPVELDQYEISTIMGALYDEAGELAASEARRTGGRGFMSGGKLGQVERLHALYDKLKAVHDEDGW